jgi:hypothetical protein
MPCSTHPGAVPTVPRALWLWSGPTIPLPVPLTMPPAAGRGYPPFRRPSSSCSKKRQLLVRRHVRWGWRPHWAKDRSAPINARVEKVAHGPFFRAIWPHRAIIAINNWFEWVDESEPKKQPYLIRHRDRSPILCAAIGQYPNAEHEPNEHDGFVIITADSTVEVGYRREDDGSVSVGAYVKRRGV